MNRVPRAAPNRSRVWARIAAALLLLVALAPLAAALAAPAHAGHCCAEGAGQLGAPPVPCQWIATTPCCDSASAVGFAPQPVPPPTILLPLASCDWEELRGIPSQDEPELSRLERLALSTIVLLL